MQLQELQVYSGSEFNKSKTSTKWEKYQGNNPLSAIEYIHIFTPITTYEVTLQKMYCLVKILTL